MTENEVRDRPIVIEFEDRQLFGIVSERDEKQPSLGVLLLQANGNAFGGRTRFTYRLAHSLAMHGVAVLRIDYGGTGESSGGVADLDSRTPRSDEVRAALAALRDMGYERVTLVGYCYGGSAALAAAEDDEDIAAIALIAPPAESRKKRATFVTMSQIARGALEPARWVALRHGPARQRYKRVLRSVFHSYRRKLFPTRGARTWLKPELLEGFVQGLGALADRRVPTLVLLGDGDRTHRTLQRADDPSVASILEPGASSIEVQTLHGGLHGLRDALLEQAAIDTVTEWVADLAPQPAEPQRTLSAP